MRYSNKPKTGGGRFFGFVIQRYRKNLTSADCHYIKKVQGRRKIFLDQYWEESFRPYFVSSQYGFKSPQNFGARKYLS
ncbi:MAG: hypothetical protein A3E07_02090 [Candidatus Wildermuthbacteria bacterium RIFCSPHIGHO2_12_FULL_45_9]|uniref:Uncharacterized protein n=1 Tax=Candidatus Wildermuthbacteria bacterium RIFCSPHIGHO2_02_FULL_45_25 TaxID=1802450 RepID=A0A1G2R4C5_9BACT|nr:MAG: hypothetical protein A2748_00580 [Candidatus Wildermuthbacteria bacterium RIFCSPHIGHO2_01_FULL_45_20]OHA67676.1 MAG: hypothetical protein A3C04_02040 [Candidatus Wildermuthbacteria bacterium RIFCSPHIGHO2_02_FULL_45_25]OHA70991.1 MAG: hypothetical protein A3E07_02090 [Candidatus Wildermuthbacteria bacterium RIFCSPHIGHO2_12_FULL_45_9]